MSNALLRSMASSAYAPFASSGAESTAASTATDELLKARASPRGEVFAAFASARPSAASWSTRRCATTSSRIARMASICFRGSPFAASTTRRAGECVAKSAGSPAGSPGDVAARLAPVCAAALRRKAPSRSKPDARRDARPSGVSSMRVAVRRSSWTSPRGDAFRAEVEGDRPEAPRSASGDFLREGLPKATRVNLGSSPAARRASASRWRSAAGERLFRLEPPPLPGDRPPTARGDGDDVAPGRGRRAFANPMPRMMASTPTAGAAGEARCACICSRSASRRAASSARSASRSRSRLRFSAGDAPTRTTTSGESSHPGLAVAPAARDCHSGAGARRGARVCSSRRRMRSRKSSGAPAPPRGAPRGLACLLSLCGEGARSRFEDAFGGAFEGEAPATLMNRVAASRSVAGSKTRASKRAPGAVVPGGPPRVLPVSRNARAPPRAAVRSRGGTPSRARSSAARSCASALAASAFDSRTAASRRDAARVDASSASASCLFFAASAFSRRRSVSSSFSRTPEGFRAATPRVSRAAGGSASRSARSCSRRACPRAATESLPPPSTLPFRRSPFGSTPPSVRFAAAYPLASRAARSRRASAAASAMRRARDPVSPTVPAIVASFARAASATALSAAGGSAPGGTFHVTPRAPSSRGNASGSSVSLRVNHAVTGSTSSSTSMSSYSGRF